MNEKKPEKREKIKGAGRLVPSAIIFAVLLLAAGPVAQLLNRLTSFITVVRLNWMVPFRLVMLVCGMNIASVLIHFGLQCWNPKTDNGKTAHSLITSAISYVMALLGVFWGLHILGVQVKALLAGAGIVALAIGFGAESLIADVITGVFLLFEKQYKVNDIIVVGDFRGTVERVGIRSTTIVDGGGNRKIINNADIRNLINRSSEASCAVCDIAIPYNGYLEKAEGLLKEALPRLEQDHPGLFLKTPEYKGVQKMDMPRNAVTLRISAQVKEVDIYAAQRTMNRDLLLAFEKGGILAPPRTDFGCREEQ